MAEPISVQKDGEASRFFVRTPLEWHYGVKKLAATDPDPDPGAMWCDDCDGRVYALEDGYICSRCDRQSDD